MQYRQLGSTDLVVSEVGFGTWTLASDWWGEIHDKDRLLRAALDAGITFFDVAPVYGDDGAGELVLADLLADHRDEIVLTTKCGYDIAASRATSGQSARPQDWRPESIRTQLDASLRRLGVDHIDLYQLHNTRIEPILDDELWATLTDLRAGGKIREIGVALGPAIGWVDEGLHAIRDRPICTLQTVFNVLEQDPGLTFAFEPNVVNGSVSLISRVPHASDTLSGRVDRDTTFPPGDHRRHRNPDNMADLFDKADALGFLWESGVRTIGQAAVAGILANPAFATVLPTFITVEDVVEYSAASDVGLTAEESERLDQLWADNFGVVNRFEMQLKTSVGAGSTPL